MVQMVTQRMLEAAYKNFIKFTVRIWFNRPCIYRGIIWHMFYEKGESAVLQKMKRGKGNSKQLKI